MAKRRKRTVREPSDDDHSDCALSSTRRNPKPKPNKLAAPTKPKQPKKKPPVSNSPYYKGFYGFLKEDAISLPAPASSVGSFSCTSAVSGTSYHHSLTEEQLKETIHQVMSEVMEEWKKDLFQQICDEMQTEQWKQKMRQEVREEVKIERKQFLQQMMTHMGCEPQSPPSTSGS